MKVLLINPPYSPYQRYGRKLGKIGGIVEPLGLAYIASFLREYRRYHEIKILDAIAMRMSVSEVIDYILNTHVDVVGISTFTPAYPIVNKIVTKLKQKNPKIVTVIGGPHASALPMETLQEMPFVDYLIKGEGELTFLELLDYLEGRKRIKDIKGVGYRRNSEIIINKDREYIENLDILPLPARDLLPMDRYRPLPSWYVRLPCYTIISSRGCPFRCVYCFKNLGYKYRTHSVNRILEEIEFLVSKYRAREIIFYDDVFTFDRDRVKEICDRMISLGLHKKTKWAVFSRVDCVDEEILDKMYKAGCRRIHYGVESASIQILKAIGKEISLEQIKKIFSLSKKIGYEVTGYFMIGLPQETREDTLKTIEFAKQLQPDWVQFTLTIPFPGTSLYYMAKRTGELMNEKWENYQSWASWAGKDLPYVPKGRDEKELKEFQIKAMKDFYLRFRYIIRLLFKRDFWINIKKYIIGGYVLLRS